MKKAIHSVKIGLIQRISASAHPNDYELTSDIEPSSIHQSTRKQALGRRISKSAISQLEVNQKKHISTLETHKDVRLNYIAETCNENQHHSKISSSSSPPLSPHLQKNIKPTQEQSVITSNLHQIPTTSKWSTRKKVLVGISTFLTIATLITVATVLAVLLTKPKETSTTTTTASTVNVSAYWSFDNTLVDSYGIYNGQPINSPTYASSTNLPYVGHGQALYFNSASNQSVLVSTPYFNLSYTSFTIEAWIYPSSLTNDRGIF
ncbi:unnamed protein product, partial [Rotaria sp. Silwood2]